jgi:cell division protein FtsW
MKKKGKPIISEWYTPLLKTGTGILDNQLIYIIFSICAVGLIALFSGSSITSQKLTEDPYYFFKKQSLWYLLSIILFIVFSSIPYSIYKKYSIHLILFSIFLLVLVFIPGVSKIVKTSTGRNFHRWIGYGQFQMQPSEFAKLAVLIYHSAFLIKYDNQNKSLLYPGIFTTAILGLIILEPALGTTIQISLTILGLIFLYGFPLKKLLIVFLSVLPLLAFLIFKVSYWRKRIDVWLNPYNDKDGDGFQLYSSFRAFMESGWLGNPLSTSHSHRSLPYNHTDFILATYVQDYGFIGFLVLIFLFSLLLFRGFILIRKVGDPFGFLLGSGIILMLGIQTIINLYVVTGLFPITGISLPFLSYGGSSLLVIMCSLGILMNITRKENLN